MNAHDDTANQMAKYEEVNDRYFVAPISKEIWDMKYRLQERHEGTVQDRTIVDTWSRVAGALAAPEKDPTAWDNEFYRAMENFKFMPAGRIIAGAGTSRNVTLFNCLSANTPILTAQYGLVEIGTIAGEVVEVLDGNGSWVEAPINSFGEQPTASVTLRGGYLGRERRVVRATAGHRWILDGGLKRITEELDPGDRLQFVKRQDVADTPAYRAGVAHGVIYGDGSFERNDAHGKTFRVRLCGAKQELSRFFDHAVQTEPPSFDGDPLLRVVGSKTDLKALPQNASVDYLTGFLRGWMATDGNVCSRDHRPSICCDADGLDWLQRYGAISGMEVRYASRLQDETNYGTRTKGSFNVSFTRWTMIEEDFLRTSHRENFGKTSTYPWSVDSVGEYSEPEPVYCPRVLTTDSVQLHAGIHTGQCFVMGTIPDSLYGIFENLKEAALTMQQGGGIGYDFSTIRPKGSLVKGVSSDASGPLSFMDVWDSMCKTIMSAGNRRGAMMATMRCDHPDIEDFIEAKQDSVRLRNFNVSVLVTDAFMEAVEENEDWGLYHRVPAQNHGSPVKKDDEGHALYFHKSVKARDLWNKIMRSTYAYAEPGVIFIDRINNDNNLNYMEKISCTNPCGEQPLPPYGACLLGSVNLAKFVLDPFTEDARLDLRDLTRTVRAAVRMMDNVVDVSKFPLSQQDDEARLKRRIGLGVTGLADMLAMMRLTYGTEEAAAVAEQAMARVTLDAYQTSVDLAKEKGPFPGFDADKFLESGFTQKLFKGLRDDIETHGIRNALLTSIAPTGTISLFANNVSSGVEPIFALSYDRKVTQRDGSKTSQRVQDFAVSEYDRLIGREPGEKLPDYFVTAQDLAPLDHVTMQAAVQPWVDSSISKTINCPEDIDFESFKDVYMEAYRTGCKGCTTYRPNDVTGSVLSVDEKPEPEPENLLDKALREGGIREEDAQQIVDEWREQNPDITGHWNADLSVRPDMLHGNTYKVKMGGDPAFYVTITDIEENGVRRPFEVFINTKNPEHIAWTTALTRMISAIFRRPHDSRFVVEELKNVFDPKGGGFWKGAYRPSVVAAIGQVIENHMMEIGYIQTVEKTEIPVLPDGLTVSMKGKPCPNCFGFNFKQESGCSVCQDCGYSSCG